MMDILDLLKMYDLCPKPSKILSEIRCSPGLESKMRDVANRDVDFPQIFGIPVIVSKWIPVDTAILKMADGSIKILKVKKDDTV